MNYWKLTALSLLLLIGLIASYYGYNYIINNSYNSGFTDGQLYIIQSISTTGNIPFMYLNENNQTVLDSKNIQELCSGESKWINNVWIFTIEIPDK